MGSALHCTTLFFSGCFQLSNLLIENGVDVDAQGGFYESALQAAASKGDKSIVQLLLDHGAEVNTKGGMYGSALQAAAISRDKSMVQLLLDRGAEINRKGGTYGSALEIAVANFWPEIVQLLLSQGALLDLPIEKWEVFLDRTRKSLDKENVQCLRYFQENQEEWFARSQKAWRKSESTSDA